MTDQPPELQLLYETAPIGLAFLTPDCRYLQINRHLTEICGISVEDRSAVIQKQFRCAWTGRNRPAHGNHPIVEAYRGRRTTSMRGPQSNILPITEIFTSAP
jgi:hypothetical protein